VGAPWRACGLAGAGVGELAAGPAVTDWLTGCELEAAKLELPL
jgi:hypothetical protein